MEEKNHLINQAICKFRQVCALDLENLDSNFNLAQALRVSAEFDQQSSEFIASDPSAFDFTGVLAKLNESEMILSHVFQKQQEVYHNQQNDNNQQTEDAVQTGQDEEEFTEDNITIETLVETILIQVQVLREKAIILAKTDLRAGDSIFMQAIEKLEMAKHIFNSSSSAEGTLVFPELELRKQLNNLTTAQLINTGWAEILWARADSIHENSSQFTQQSFIDLSTTLSFALEKLECVIRVEPRNVEALSDQGDVFVTLAEIYSSCSQIDSASADKLLKECRSAYSNACKSFVRAHEIETANAPLLTKLGDVHLTRVGLHSLAEAKSINTLSANAVFYYKKALANVPIEDKQERLLIAFRMAKSLSYYDEEECKVVLEKWKQALIQYGFSGTQFVNDTEVQIGFNEILSKCEWFRLIFE